MQINTNTKLYSNYYLFGIIITFILIILLELGKFPVPLIAQNSLEEVVIQLTKGEDIRKIYNNDWVGVIQKGNVNPIIGRVRGNIQDSLLIENQKTHERISVSFSEIEILYHGEKGRMGYYTLKGMNYGILAAFFYGSGVSVLMAMDDGIQYAPIAYMCGSAVFIPPGTLLGFLKGLSKDKKAIEYNLYNSDWKII
jgi:hypothetical protein